MKNMTLLRNDPRLLELEQKDPKLTSLFNDVGDLPITLSWDAFSFMVFTIIGQQLSVKVVEKLYQKVIQACGGTLTPKRVLNLSYESLRALGLSGRKAEYLHTTSHAFLEGHFHPSTFSLSEKDALFTHLQKIRGIGPWTVDMFVMFVLDDMDHFSKKDLGLIHGYNRFFKRELTPDQIEKDALNWRPYRSIVAHYLWHVHDR